MPTYEYRCRSCGEPLEVVQSFTDDPLTECPACGGQLRKVFHAVGIAFKGSGFYKTDSRTAAKSSSSASASESSSSSDSKSTSSGSSDSKSRSSGSNGDGASSGDGVKSSSPSSSSSSSTATAGSA
jgi:putative FmdB family regulatory protein